GKRETDTRDDSLVNDAKDEHVGHSEAAVNSNGDGETSTMDQNLVNSGKDEPAQLLGATVEKS
ncbi:WEB family protein, partial [Trifolium medium]|nr:WEB family protein [Trifolium medium]